VRLNEYISGFDRRLAFPWMSSTGLRLTGYKLNEVYMSPQKHLELAIAMDKKFGADFIYPLDYGAIFIEPLGLPQLKPDFDFPSTLDNPVKTEKHLAMLPDLDFIKDEKISSYLAGLKMISSSSDKPMAMSIRGPFTVAVELVGITDFARAIIRNPEFVRKVLDYSFRLVARYALAVSEAGADLLCISEPTAVILSPERFKVMVGGPLRDIFSTLPENVWRVLHICGDTNYLMKEMIGCGVDGLSLDQIMDFTDVVKQVPSDIVLIGNLDPVYVLRKGDVAQIRESTFGLLESMREYPNFLFSFGCDCVPDTPFNNLKAAIHAAQRTDYGYKKPKIKNSFDR
jgi:uroporphyrinogen decarboxylase